MNLKAIGILVFLIHIAPSLGFASEGSSSGTRGGGDLCEDQIKLVRDDLKDWIQKGGPNGLTLPSEISVARYSDQMLAAIGSAKIRCVGPDDDGFPVLVGGTPKICRFDKSWFNNQITCDLAKIMSLNESERYVLIHHEYAGLTGIETPNRDDSVYGISNQISEYLVDQTVKKLAVKQVSSGTTMTGEALTNFKEYLSDSLNWELTHGMSCGMAGVMEQDPGESYDDGVYRYIKYELEKATSATLSESSGSSVWTIENPVREASGAHKRVTVVIRISPDHKYILSIEMSSFTDEPRKTGDLLNPTYSRVFKLSDFKYCKIPEFELPAPVKQAASEIFK